MSDESNPPAGEQPSIRGTSVFVPARDWALSRRFYTRLIGAEGWCEGKLAAFRIGTTELLVQDFYVQDWAENSVLYFHVDDVEDWHRHLDGMRASGEFDGMRIQPPRDEPWGVRMVTAWDPSGVLLHFAQPVA